MISARLEESDYLCAQFLDRRWQPRNIVGAIALSCLACAISWLLWSTGKWIIAAGILGGLVGGAIGGSIVRYVYVPWKTKRVFRQQKSLQREFTLSWETTGVQTKSVNGEFTCNWSDFIRWKENEILFLLYLSDIQFLMVPKRAFSNMTEIDLFRSNIAQGINV